MYVCVCLCVRMCVCEQTAGVQCKLLDLLESKFMAFSIRLLILKALDASLRFPSGVRWFLGSHPQQDKGKDQVTAYQRIVQLMTKKQVMDGEGSVGLIRVFVVIAFFLLFLQCFCRSFLFWGWGEGDGRGVFLMFHGFSDGGAILWLSRNTVWGVYFLSLIVLFETVILLKRKEEEIHMLLFYLLIPYAFISFADINSEIV